MIQLYMSKIETLPKTKPFFLCMLKNVITCKIFILARVKK